MSPDFIIRVVSNYNGNGQLLQWETRPLLEPIGRDPMWREAKLFGRFACYRLGPATPMELEPETMMVHVPIETMAALRAALTGTSVPRGLKSQIDRILAEATAGRF